MGCRTALRAIVNGDRQLQSKKLQVVRVTVVAFIREFFVFGHISELSVKRVTHSTQFCAEFIPSSVKRMKPIVLRTPCVANDAVVYDY